MRGRQLPWYNTFLAPDGDASGAGKKKDDEGGGGDDDAKVLQQLQRLMKQSGGGEQALKVLFDNNLQIRVKYQRARDRVKELEARTPGDGDVVLKGDDAKAWAAIVALKIPVAEVAPKLAKVGEAEAKLATYERNDTVRKAAELLGYDADVLIDRIERDALHLEIATSTEKVDGQDVTTQTPRVRKASEATGALTDLTAYTDQHWTKYKPSLLKGDAPAGPPAATAAAAAAAARHPAPITRSGQQRTNPGASADQLAKDAAATGQYARF